MELIAEYEGIKRTFYSGSIGYFGFDGIWTVLLLVPTAMILEDQVILQAGAGIVADQCKRIRISPSSK